MKSFSCGCYFLSVLIIFNAVKADRLTELKEIRDKCRTQEKLTIDEITMKDTIPSNTDCYLLCILNQFHIVDDKNYFDPVIAIDSLEETLREAAKPHIDACFAIQKDMGIDDLCKTAMAIVTCFNERAPSLSNLMGIYELASE